MTMTEQRRGLLPARRPGRFTFMVAVLLAYVLVAPVTPAGTVANRVVNLAMVLTLLGIIRLSWPGHPVQAIAAALGLGALLPTLGLWSDASIAGLASHIASILFILTAIGAILRQVMAAEEVTLDIVIGAASVYLLIGLLWGGFYVLLDFTAPGSFRYPTDFHPEGPMRLLPLMKDTILLYYSFETLTTIGFGDITPASPPARFLSVCEALVGQLYLAVLVARFVGLQVSHHSSRGKS
jgi:voltage-gated potassium channel